MRRGGLERLLPLAAMVRDAELQGLGRLSARVEALASQVRQLRADRAARDRARALDPARMSGADIAWARWCDRRLAELQRRIAALELERAERIATARRAFGRAAVLEKLAQQQAAPRRR